MRENSKQLDERRAEFTAAPFPADRLLKEKK
jgi:hypothetical protein